MSSGLTGATYGEMCPAFPASYYRARYYDLVTGRFLSEDPLGFAVDGNHYIYANNMPSNANDPTGHDYQITYDGKGTINVWASTTLYGPMQAHS